MLPCHVALPCCLAMLPSNVALQCCLVACCLIYCLAIRCAKTSFTSSCILPFCHWCHLCLELLLMMLRKNVYWFLIHFHRIFSGLSYGQQQYFRVLPTDVHVGEGGVAVINCAVENRAGRVQWTKDGLTLGKNTEHFS